MKIIRILMTAATAFLLNSTLVYSENISAGLSDSYSQFKDYETSSHKDQCLVVARNCVGGEESVRDRVDRLNREIDKGLSVYTPEELKRLQEQLNWIYYESGEYPEIRL